MAVDRIADLEVFTLGFQTLIRSMFQARMAVNLLGALTFCWFLPQQKEQCKDWAEELGKC